MSFFRNPWNMVKKTKKTLQKKRKFFVKDRNIDVYEDKR
jgi:hypothetical protein